MSEEKPMPERYEEFTRSCTRDQLDVLATLPCMPNRYPYLNVAVQAELRRRDANEKPDLDNLLEELLQRVEVLERMAAAALVRLDELAHAGVVMVPDAVHYEEHSLVEAMRARGAIVNPAPSADEAFPDELIGHAHKMPSVADGTVSSTLVWKLQRLTDDYGVAGVRTTIDELWPPTATLS